MSCSNENEAISKDKKPSGVKVIPKFSVGDVVYLKPDSLAVVITGMNPYPTVPKYSFSYYASNEKMGTFRKTGTVSEKLIY